MVPPTSYITILNKITFALGIANILIKEELYGEIFYLTALRALRWFIFHLQMSQGDKLTGNESFIEALDKRKKDLPPDS